MEIINGTKIISNEDRLVSIQQQRANIELSIRQNENTINALTKENDRLLLESAKAGGMIEALNTIIAQDKFIAENNKNKELEVVKEKGK